MAGAFVISCLRKIVISCMPLILAFCLALPFIAGPVNAHNGPDSVADLAESLLDAVVNISITTKSANNRTRRRNRTPEQPSTPKRDKPPGDAPFEDLFDEFFQRQQSRPNGDNRLRGQGSGFVIDPSGFIVTNNHVIEGAAEIVINFVNGDKYTAKLIGTDDKTDIALLKIDTDKSLPYVSFGSSNVMRVGNWVMVIGNPFGLGSSVSVGIISALNRDIRTGPYDNYLQTDAAINQGNSGGPLFNRNGEVIGVNTAIFSPSGGGSVGVGFSVPSDTAKLVVSQLREFGETRRGWLGVSIDEVPKGLAKTARLGKPRGALVTGVNASGPAKKAGLQAGDIIITFNGNSVSGWRDLPRMVARTPVGTAVDVIIVRNGDKVTLQVSLGRLDEKGTPVASSKKPAKKEPTSPSPGILGMILKNLTPELRTRHKISSDVKGVIIIEVAGNTKASERKIRIGDVITEVNQSVVGTVDDIKKRLAGLKQDDRKSALLLLSTKGGGSRFVSLQLEE